MLEACGHWQHPTKSLCTGICSLHCLLLFFFFFFFFLVPCALFGKCRGHRRSFILGLQRVGPAGVFALGTSTAAVTSLASHDTPDLKLTRDESHARRAPYAGGGRVLTSILRGGALRCAVE